MTNYHKLFRPLIDGSDAPSTARAARTLADELQDASGTDVVGFVEAIVVGLTSVLVSMGELEREVNALKRAQEAG